MLRTKTSKDMDKVRCTVPTVTNYIVSVLVSKELRSND